jgi:hypothetical protein
MGTDGRLSITPPPFGPLATWKKLEKEPAVTDPVFLMRDSNLAGDPTFMGEPGFAIEVITDGSAVRLIDRPMIPGG